MNIETLKTELIRDESLRLKPYKDSVGKLTIGVGRNLDDRGISASEANLMLENDIQIAIADASSFPFWPNLTEARQRVLVNMTFNMGISRLKGFVNMLVALEVGDYGKAADEMSSSLWARQVKERAVRLEALMRDGV